MWGVGRKEQWRVEKLADSISPPPDSRDKRNIDAMIDFDLRTAAATPSAPKRQPRWLAAAYGSFVNKEGANYQIQIGALFRYDRCPELRHANSIGLIAEAWLACKPLVDLKR